MYLWTDENAEYKTQEPMIRNTYVSRNRGSSFIVFPTITLACYCKPKWASGLFDVHCRFDPKQQRYPVVERAVSVAPLREVPSTELAYCDDSKRYGLLLWLGINHTEGEVAERHRSWLYRAYYEGGQTGAAETAYEDLGFGAREAGTEALLQQKVFWWVLSAYTGVVPPVKALRKILDLNKAERINWSLAILLSNSRS